MQFPVNSVQETGKYPRGRGPVTTCTTGLCAACGRQSGQQSLPDRQLAAPTLPPDGGAASHSLAFLQSSCRFRGFYRSVSGLPLPHRAGKKPPLLLKTGKTRFHARRSLKTVAHDEGGVLAARGSRPAQDCGSWLSISEPARTRFALAVFKRCTKAEIHREAAWGHRGGARVPAVRREIEKSFALLAEWRYHSRSVPGGALLDESL